MGRLSTLPQAKMTRAQVRSVPCPDCGVNANEKCVGAGGKSRTSSHAARLGAYREASTPKRAISHGALERAVEAAKPLTVLQIVSIVRKYEELERAERALKEEELREAARGGDQWPPYVICRCAPASKQRREKRMELETINKLYLELSQITTATTAREMLLQKQLAEAQKDSDRLDWIEQNANMGVVINRLKLITDLSRLVYEVAVDDVYVTEDTLRAAIDAAKGGSNA